MITTLPSEGVAGNVNVNTPPDVSAMYCEFVVAVVVVVILVHGATVPVAPVAPVAPLGPAVVATRHVEPSYTIVVTLKPISIVKSSATELIVEPFLRTVKLFVLKLASSAITITALADGEDGSVRVSGPPEVLTRY